MQTVTYAGLSNGSRDQAIQDALIYKQVTEFASEFELSPSTVGAAAKRIASASVYNLVLLRGASWNQMTTIPARAAPASRSEAKGKPVINPGPRCQS